MLFFQWHLAGPVFRCTHGVSAPLALASQTLGGMGIAGRTESQHAPHSTMHPLLLSKLLVVMGARVGCQPPPTLRLERCGGIGACIMTIGSGQAALDEAVQITDDLIDTVMEEYSQWLESADAQAPEGGGGEPHENKEGCCSSACSVSTDLCMSHRVVAKTAGSGAAVHASIV